MNIAYSATPMPRAMTGGIREENPAPISVPLSQARYTVTIRPRKKAVVSRSSSEATTKVSSVIPNPSTRRARFDADRGRCRAGSRRERDDAHEEMPEVQHQRGKHDRQRGCPAGQQPEGGELARSGVDEEGHCPCLEEAEAGLRGQHAEGHGHRHVADGDGDAGPDSPHHLLLLTPVPWRGHGGTGRRGRIQWSAPDASRFTLVRRRSILYESLTRRSIEWV